MFRRNETHNQNELFGCESLLSEGKLQKLKDSEQSGRKSALFFESKNVLDTIDH